METHQDSTIIHLLRAGVLLAALIAVPGTAVCWNLIPKDMFREPKSNRFACELNEGVSEESTETAFQPAEVDTPAPAVPAFEFHATTAGPGELSGIKRMGRDPFDQTTERSISTDISPGRTVWALETSPQPPQPLGAVLSGEPLSEPRTFPALEKELKQLGAKYYRLEKWGSRGELFRFTCYVTPEAPYHYQKHFQAVDSDELRVMERVLAEIKAWKESPGGAP